jgi:GrpB-like predicted nucleotidyltransferase (UPF0157 family)
MRGIRVVEYDPTWPLLFETRRQSVAVLLLPLDPEILHFGSTSVPGLASKPRIDIDAVFGSESELPDAIERIKMSGDYVFNTTPGARPSS